MIAITFVALALSAQSVTFDIRIESVLAGEQCGWTRDGELLDQSSLRVRAGEWAKAGQSVAFVMAEDTPTSCAVEGLMLVRAEGVKRAAAIPGPDVVNDDVPVEDCGE